jgi:hypothetical protein
MTVYALSLLLLSACIPEPKDKTIAHVFGKSLYLSEIKHLFSKDMSQEDSVTLAKFYVDKWIETQLLLKKAELNLPKEQLDIAREMETYRTSLLIYKYEDRMLREKLDTVVSDAEIQRYYESNLANFILDEYAVKALYIQLPLGAPTLYNVRRWYISDKEQDIEDLNQYCATNAVVFENYNDNWVRWSDVAEKIPQPEEASKRMLYSSRLEFQDEKMIYLLYLKEKKQPGDVSPLLFVREKIKNIIINKRKVEFIARLEKNIYSDALAKKQFEIY